ncbi:hypothetical protein [Actinophytocola sp.]|uniref:hypothetical protein n=1 Tax=Actinophytocola sp. TaxID=1872138 RepID=UPI002ED15613
MRIARLFDGRDSAGEWTFAPDRPRITDPDERARIASFLRGGKMILRVPGSDVDRIEPANGQLVPISTRTDGIWIWSTGLRYYVEKHGIAPEPDFLAHIVAHEYVAPMPDEPGWRAALAELQK